MLDRAAGPSVPGVVQPIPIEQRRSVRNDLRSLCIFGVRDVGFPLQNPINHAELVDVANRALHEFRVPFFNRELNWANFLVVPANWDLPTGPQLGIAYTLAVPHVMRREDNTPHSPPWGAD